MVSQKNNNNKIKKEGPKDRKLVGKKVEGKKPPLTKSTFIEAVSSD